MIRKRVVAPLYAGKSSVSHEGKSLRARFISHSCLAPLSSKGSKIGALFRGYGFLGSAQGTAGLKHC